MKKEKRRRMIEQLKKIHLKVERFFEQRRKEASLKRAVALWLLASLLWTVLNPVGLRSLLQTNVFGFVFSFTFIAALTLAHAGLFYFLAKRSYGGKGGFYHVVYLLSVILMIACPLGFIFFLLKDASVILILASLLVAYLGLTALKTSMKISYGRAILIWVWVSVLLGLAWFALLFSTLIFGPKLR